ncbi:P-loop containing nucleoside triphosphate hydrolase protein [Kalaharituber pfeilii]|nr:P-loop containing nucleoside triphosphate hydrolase protein [Kalaharituber pfeilii]
MADDGMLMNLDVSAAPPPLRATAFKGGRGGRGRGRGRAAPGGHAHAGKKRKRAPDGSAPAAPPRHRPRSSAATTTAAADTLPPAGEKGQFISSLWTSNPAPSTPAPRTTNGADPPDVERAPTNAPLSDGSVTFTTLGLSSALAAHLTTKMSLKAPTAIQKAAIPELLNSDSDAFIQAQTGSGKTLTYLLPILDRIRSLAPLQTIPAPAPQPSTAQSSPDSKLPHLHRSSGLFAIILAPTRELARQIMSVLTTLTFSHAHHWIVPGCVTGGEKKKSEKARLRKGMNILVATPGRLLDHLENTESLDVSRVRWMVLDEGDMLMELGFEETIKQILELVGKRGKVGGVREGRLPKRRVTVLCSATMKTNVQRLGDLSLTEASYVKADPQDKEKEKDTQLQTQTQSENTSTPIPAPGGDITATKSTQTQPTFLAPSQLKQSYVLVPPKQRFVALYAVLKRAFLRAPANMKAIVYFSCADSVDFHFEAFTEGIRTTAADKGTNGSSDSERGPPTLYNPPCPSLHPTLLLHRLHGSLPQPQRISTLHSFTHPPGPQAPSLSKQPVQKSTRPTLLFSTDVTSRGLDLPNVDLIVQLDPPFSSADYIHRIGRTARAGRPGRAIIFLLEGTGEAGYVERLSLSDILDKGFCSPSPSSTNKKPQHSAANTANKYESAATALQLRLESTLLSTPSLHQLAKRAWTSHVRAYATHEAGERDMFDVRKLHMGHLAKGFGLRERPGEIAQQQKKGKGKEGSGVGKKAKGERKAVWDDEDEVGKKGSEKEAAERMRKMARLMQGKGREGLAGEFNIG